MKHPAHVHIAPPDGRDVAAVDRLLADTGRRRKVARPAVVCPKGHPLAWLLRVDGDRVLVANAVRVQAAPVVDDPSPRLTRSSGPWGEASGEWSELGATRLYDWLDATTTVSWGVECDCGPAELRRSWLDEQAAADRSTVTLPT